MKILIDHSKLIGVPFNTDLNSAMFYFEEEKLNEIKNTILYEHNSSILISGYRGAGKTSFVNKVEEIINKEATQKERIHFVKLNLSKYNGYSILIRKIIRAVYESIPEEDLKEINKEDPELAIKLGLLYERTFNDVTAINNFEQSNQTKRVIKSTLNGKKFTVLFFSIIGAALNLFFNFSEFLLNKETFSKFINWVIFLFLGIWGTLETVKYDLSWSKQEINKQVLNRQSLYDDEIAEHRLIEILSELKKKNIKFVIVLDELDKIAISEVEDIISELKFLMLSGLATFIIVAGQQLYYKYSDSPVEDDSILSSLFSNIIHIPLSDNEIFKRLTDEILIDKSLLDNDIVSNYISSLTLVSNRLPRRFINLLRQEIKWDGNIAYLEITDQDSKHIVLARSLEVIEKIEGKELHEIYEEHSDGIKDFFSFQLYRWLQIIIRKKDVPFKIEDILDADQKDLPPYLSRYNMLLSDLAELLKDRLLEANVLSQISKTSEEEFDKYLFTYEIVEASENNDKYNHNSKFIKNINNINQLLNNLSQYAMGLSTTAPIEDKVKILVENNYLSHHWTKSIKRLYTLSKISEKLSNNISLSAEEVNLLQESHLQANRFEAELLESYFFLLTKRIFENSNHEINTKGPLSNTKQLQYKADFYLLNDQQYKPDIVFEIKLSTSSLNSNAFKREIDNFKEYNRVTNKENYLVLIFNELNIEIDRVNQRLSHLIKDPEIIKFVKVYLANNYSEESFKAFINENIILD